MKLIQTVRDNQSTEVKKTKLNKLAESVGLKTNWDGDSASGSIHYGGFEIPGTITVTAGAVTISVELPGIARLRKAKIEKELEKEISKALE